jgi:hypothetical protein
MKEWKNKIVEVRKGKKEGEKKSYKIVQNWNKKKYQCFFKKDQRLNWIELDNWEGIWSKTQMVHEGIWSNEKLNHRNNWTIERELVETFPSHGMFITFVNKLLFLSFAPICCWMSTSYSSLWSYSLNGLPPKFCFVCFAMDHFDWLITQKKN